MEMLADLPKNLLEALKLAPRYLVALGAAAALLLFGPAEVLKKMGVSHFADEYRPWLGLTVIVTGCLFVVSVVLSIFHWFQRKRRESRFRERGMKRLRNLTEEEKQILRFYFAKESKTNVLRIDDGVVQGLVSAGIIYRSARVGNIIEGFAHNISDFAWRFIHEHPEVLQGSTNLYRTDKREGWFT